MESQPVERSEASARDVSTGQREGPSGSKPAVRPGRGGSRRRTTSPQDPRGGSRRRTTPSQGRYIPPHARKSRSPHTDTASSPAPRSLSSLSPLVESDNSPASALSVFHKHVNQERDWLVFDRWSLPTPDHSADLNFNKQLMPALRGWLEAYRPSRILQERDNVAWLVVCPASPISTPPTSLVLSSSGFKSDFSSMTMRRQHFISACYPLLPISLLELIIAYCGTGAHCQTCGQVESVSANLLKDWQDLQNWSVVIDPANIVVLAKEHNILTGKWIAYITSHKIDRVWSHVAEETMLGRLGIAAKVSPCVDIPLPTRSPGDGAIAEEQKARYVPNEAAREQSHCLQVVTCNYLNEKELFGVRDRVCALLQREREGRHSPITLFYKPEIHSQLGIYRGNRFGLQSSLYHSKSY
eukprot:gb/GEZN01008643.1/.p1 GENE.gb/GEZN01008643.1/~~gb/GEZN01008643.1/.p1  ORF type:complete len:412 (-),score=39.16 gb/GEZN01008643.1/:117-1352(-)